MRTGVLERDGHGLKAVLTTGKAVHSGAVVGLNHPQTRRYRA